ncbi:MAG: beta strand repeat-containing protein [Sphingobium sp.]
MRIRTRLFCTCAVVLVMGTVAAIKPADAQGGFLGNVTSSMGFGGGNPTFQRSGTGDIIEVRSEQTVIDWRPDDQAGTGTIDFLPTANNVVFQNGISTTFSNFTVLNRIQPIDGATQANTSRVVALNGNVSSNLNGNRAGSVWFYTPGGIVVGSTGVFDVGSLLLTTNNIDVSDGLFDQNNSIRIRGVAGNTAGVTVNSGARINATAANSYVALVAPRIVQGGIVTVDGSTAYVAAEQADIRINGGLFDIAITAGSTDANGVVHSGTTTGPASTGTADRQNIYMVAVPKNNALTMLLSGTIGYPGAATATQDGSGVVLSAGYGVSYDASDNLNLSPPLAGTGTAGLNITTQSLTSALSLNAVDDIAVAPTGTLQFNTNTTITAGNSISLTANAGVAIRALGDLTLNAGNGPNGGSITLAANGAAVAPSGQGLINITSALNINTTASGNSSQPDAVGGPVTFTANRGTINAGVVDIQTIGNAGLSTLASGNATGGDVALSVANSGQMNFTTTTVNASGNSVFDNQNLPLTGGNATGGTVRFSSTGGSLNLGEVRATAQATGGSVTDGTAGNATSGNIIVDLGGGTHNWPLFFGDVSATAGFSRTGQGNAGSVTPGATGIFVDVYGTAALNIAQSVSLYGDAYSFSGNDVAGVTQAAPIRVQTRDGGSLQIVNDLTVQSNAAVSNFGFGGRGNVTNEARGATVLIGALGGIFSASGINVGVAATAADGFVDSGSAFGGSVTLASAMSSGLRGNFALTDCVTFGCSVNASANGAGGNSNGTGGTILAYAGDADMAITGLSLSAQGRGGSSDQLPSMGVGGTISIESRRGTLNNGTLSIGELNANASASPQLLGESSNLSDSNASGGAGGSVVLALDGGTFTSNNVTLRANGTGADAAATEDGGVAAQAGEGTGGTISMQMNGANATIGSLTIEANGIGGSAEGSFAPTSISALAGAGRGGSASLLAAAGTLTVGTLAITANGVGGGGIEAFDAAGADGGAGIGGTAQFIMDVGSSAVVNVNTLPGSNVTVSATGTGGVGSTTSVFRTTAAFGAGAGGAGTGGDASLLLAGGILNTPLLTVSATGTGGDGGRNGSDGAGGNAGDGTGGSAQFTFANEGHSLDVIAIEARGKGGFAGDAKAITGFDSVTNQPIFAFGVGAGGNGGSGTGGRASMQIDVDPVLAGLGVNANGAGTAGGIGATGGNGGAGNGGTNGLGAQLTVNFGSLTVTGLLDISSEGFGGAGGNGTTGRGGDGGIGTAGESGLIATGSNTQVQTNILQIISYGLGGDGGDSGTQSGTGLPGGSGAAAFGGTAGLLVADNAQFTFGQSTVISAGAIGGTGRVGTAGTISADGGSGGNATGGIARLSVQNATLTDGADGDVQIFAGALAGVGGFGTGAAGLGGRGGNGLGGLAQIEGASGTIGLNTVTVSAVTNGGSTPYGPSGNIGGSAQGGTASADFFNLAGTTLPGTATFASLTLGADAYAGTGGGGANGLGGTGGSATGGTAAASVDGAGIAARFDIFAATATALGGDAGTAQNPGVAGAAGGSATGGRARFDATGGSQTIFGAQVTILADATGGAGGTGSNGAIGGNGGTGGMAFGGDARLTINAAQVLANGSDDYAISAQASGGAGGVGGTGSSAGASGGLGGDGGDSTGGLALFSATTGDFDLPGLSILANGTGGLSGTGGSGPSSQGNPSATPPVPPSGPIQSAAGISGGGSGGIAQLLNSDAGGAASIGQHDISSVTLQANGIFPPESTTGFAPIAGRVDITDTSSASNGGLVVNGALTAEAFGEGACACSGIFVSSSVNPVQTGDSFLSTDGSISFAFASSGSFRASGALFASSGGTITVTQGSQGTTPVDSLFANTLTLNAPGDIVTNSLAILRSTDAMDIASQGGTVQLAQLFAGGTMNVTALAGSIGMGNATAGGNLTATAATSLTANSVNSTTGDVTLTAGAGSIQIANSSAGRDFVVDAVAGDALQSGTLTVGRSINFAGNNVSLGTAIAGDDISLNARAGLATLQNGTTTGVGATNGSNIALTGTAGAVIFNGTAIDDIVIDGGADAFVSGSASAGRDILVTARAGNASTATTNAGRNVVVSASGTVLASDATAGGLLQLSALSGTVEGGTVSGGRVVINGDQGVSFSSISSQGTTSLTAINGAIETPSLASLDVVSVTAQAIDLTGAGALNFASALATAGDLNLSGGTLNVTVGSASNDITLISTSGSLNARTLSGRNIIITSADAASLMGPLTIGGTLQVTAIGALTTPVFLTAVDDILLHAGSVAAGTLTAGGILDVSASGTVTIGTAQSFGNASLSGDAGVNVTNIASAAGDIFLNSADGTVQFTTADAARDLIAAAGGATGSVQQTGTGATAGRDITLTAPTIATAALNAGRTLTLNAGRDLSANALTATGAVLLNSGGAVNVSGTISGASLQAVSASSLVLSGPVRTPGNVSAQAGTTASIDDLSAGGTVSIAGAQGITARALSSGGAATLASAIGGVAVETLTSGNEISISAGTDTNLGAATAAGAVQISARGTARFIGTTLAPTIQVTSGDIVIGGGARLGLQGTTGNLTISAFSGQGSTYIGGGDQAGAYSLSGDEMTRLFAQNILISPQGQTTIGSFTLTSGTTGNLGPSGILTINSGGRLEVVGAVQLTGLGAQGGLTLRSGNGIDVFTDTGSIDLRGSGNALGGMLTLEGASVGVGTRSALTDIAGTTVTLDARSARLARNDGSVSDDGFLRAGSINLNVVQGAYIQNSGTGTAFADRRGFTANSLAIRTEGSGTQIVVNGRLADSTGSFITGVGTIPLASINGVAGGQVGSYADRSTINGCLIGNVVSCTVVVEEVTPTIPSDDRDAIDRILDPTVAVRQIFPVAIVELRDFVAEGYPPLIDEPVTGAGNEDLWDSDCSVSGDEGCDVPVGQ